MKTHFRVESATDRKAALVIRRRADRNRRHAAIREHLKEAISYGWVASSTLFATGDFFAAQVAKRIERQGN